MTTGELGGELHASRPFMKRGTLVGSLVCSECRRVQSLSFIE